MIKPLIPLGLTLLALAGCETPTFYQPAASPTAVGYSELRIEPGRYRVTFQGGSGAPASEVSDFVLLRAAEITVRDGYDWFRVTAREGDRAPPRSSSSVSIGAGGGSFGRGGGFGLGLGTSIPLGGGPQITRSVEILAGHAPQPTDPDIYDARGILKAINPRAPHPAPRG